MKHVTVETIEACTIIKSRSFCSDDIDYYKCIFFYKLELNRSLKKIYCLHSQRNVQRRNLYILNIQDQITCADFVI